MVTIYKRYPHGPSYWFWSDQAAELSVALTMFSEKGYGWIVLPGDCLIIRFMPTMVID